MIQKVIQVTNINTNYIQFLRGIEFSFYYSYL